MANEKLYYVQDIRSFDGNSCFWWAKGGHGYTSDIKRAEQWTEHDAQQLVTDAPKKYRAWPVDYIDQNEQAAKTVIDSQYLNRDQSFPLTNSF